VAISTNLNNSVASCSSLSLVMASFVIKDFGEVALHKPLFWFCYVIFLDCMNIFQQNIQLTMELTKHGHLPFLGINIYGKPKGSQSQSQSYITTDSQSVSMSWCWAQSGTFDHRSYIFSFFLFFFFWKLLSCHLGVPSLTRGRVCYLPVFVNTVYSGQYLHKFLHSVLDTVYIYNI
jgi:hypothetical protein